MAQTPLEPGAALVVEVDKPGQTVSLVLRQNHDDAQGTFIAMAGDLSSLPYIKWLAESAAAYHHIPCRVEEYD